MTQELVSEVENELKNILSYWSERMVDNEKGGFYGRITGRNQLVEDAPKGSILNTRILWTYSAAYKFLPDPSYLEIATRAYEYFIQHFIDKENGGVYWMVDQMGKPLETKKQIYAQAFAIYSLSEYYHITHNEESLKKAIEIYQLIEKHSFDPIHNGYLEAFDREWKEIEDLRLSDKDANEKKTMNTHLHILEAYANLRRVWDNPGLSLKLKNIIEVFLDKIIDHKTNHFNLFFDERWTVKSEEISFGHDIEGSWLLLEAAEVLGDKELIDKVKKVALEMAKVTLKEGVDDDGGIFNEADHTKIYDTDKHWWPQAEALVGFINAYQISKDENFLTATYHVWDFIKNNIIDKKEGEWFWRVSRDRIPNFDEDKAGPWKCPYHNGRACMEIIARLKKI